MSRVLGLDIGGNGSRAQLSVDGKVVAERSAASASVVAVGKATAGTALSQLLGQLPVDPARRVDAVCVGSAGGSIPDTQQFLTSHLEPLTRPGMVLVVSDALLVLPAAGLDVGVAVTCGTGSAVAGRYQGDSVQSGGWGYLLGDEGSGYWIVRSAIRVLLDRKDRGVPPGELGERLFKATSVRTISALQGLFYATPQPRVWAKHAPVVLDNADPAAATIAARAAEALAGLAVSAAERLAAPSDLPVVLSGGLLAHGGLEAAVRKRIEKARPGSDVRILETPPVTGAVRLAEAAAKKGRASLGPA
jgi:glucosamine kinase